MVTELLHLVREVGSFFWVMVVGYKGSSPWAMSKLNFGS